MLLGSSSAFCQVAHLFTNTHLYSALIKAEHGRKGGGGGGGGCVVYGRHQKNWQEEGNEERETGNGIPMVAAGTGKNRESA